MPRDMKEQFTANAFLRLYLEYVENTESPRVFHMFSALAGIGACLGRRVFIRRGHSLVFGNMYVTLVGPPAMRKSTAMQIAAGLVKKSTYVRIAPDDTGSQRQGLIKAMIGDKDDDLDPDADEILKGITNSANASLDALMSMTFENRVDPKDKQCMFATSEEITSLIGTNANEMLTFLIRVWDGQPYTYQLRKDLLELSDPLLSIIGCTTTENLAASLPAAAIGGGFMSRMLLVYSNAKYKQVKPSEQTEPDERIEQKLQAVFNNAFVNMHGEMRLSAQASEAVDALYTAGSPIHDQRFIYYAERRHVHLQKLAMCLAAARSSMLIEIADVEEASRLLRAIEAYMPDALGEYGLSKLSTARQKMMDVLKHSKKPIPGDMLFGVLHRDMSIGEFQNALADLVAARKIHEVNIPERGRAYVYMDTKQKQVDELLKYIADPDGVGDEGPEEPEDTSYQAEDSDEPEEDITSLV